MDQATKPNASSSVTPDGDSPGAAVDLTGKTLGDYRILRRLGQGGMGQIYLAEQISLKRHVALKLLKPELAANALALARFKAEAEAVARATHANIVQIYAIHDIDGHHLIALEYVEGRNLREFLEKKGPPEILLGLSIIRQVAAALQRAGELGIIHRDIKPENILLTRKGEVKVADFGLSRILTESGAQPPNLTQSHVTMGTPLYMSPEQVEGKKTIDHRTDIYSFGVTCYHMFAGHPPFKGTAPFEVAVQHVQKEPMPLAEIRPDLPPELCAIVHKMMIKAPADRYQMGREIVRDIAKLRDVLVGASQAVALTVPAMAPGAAHPSDLVATLALPSRQPSPWPRRLLFAALPLALAGGLGLGWLRTHAGTVVPALPLHLPENPVPAAKAVDPLKEREQALFELIHEQKTKPIQLKVAAGLDASIVLGLLYLNDRNRINDADLFFKKLTAVQKPFAYKILGKLGTAMVLAFKDQPDESNKLFLAILAKDKAEEKGRWNNEPSLREMIARALHFNLQNNPSGFPDKLRPYLQPPVPTLKTLPAP
jgi:serine/threonine protein kinase